MTESREHRGLTESAKGSGPLHIVASAITTQALVPASNQQRVINHVNTEEIDLP